MWNRFLLLIVCFSLVPGQDYSVMGSITDFYTGEPVENAIITCWTSPDSVLIASDTTDSDGNYAYSFSVVNIDSRQLPDKFGLQPNYPNPFNPSTVIPFSITNGGEYSLSAYNILGQRLDRTEFVASPGIYSVQYDGAGGAAGLQFIELRGNGQRSVQKVILLDGGGSQGFQLGSGGAGPNILAKPAENQPVTIRIIQEDYEDFEEQSDLPEGTSVINYQVPANTYMPELSLIVLIDSLAEDSFAPITVATFDLTDPDQQQSFLVDFQYSNHELGTLAIHAPTASIILYLLTPNAFGTFEYQFSVEDDDGNSDTVSSQLQILSVDDLPEMRYNIDHNGIGEDTTGFPITLIDQLEFMDVDVGESVDSVVFRWQHPDSVFMSWDGTSVLVDSVRAEWNGSFYFNFDIYQNGSVAAIDTVWSEVRAKPDVTLIMRTLMEAGTPIIDYIESTFQIGDSTYQGFGQITKQLEPGVSYEIWAENDSTGLFHDSTGQRIDPFLSIRSGDNNPLVTPALETRAIDDQSSALSFGANDIMLDLYKIKVTQTERNTMNYIIDNWGPPGIDKPNTASPQCYIDTSFSTYTEPTVAMVENAQYVIGTLLPTISEGRYTPVWMGFGTPPLSDPNGPTILTFKFDEQYAPPGNSSNLITDDNVLYRASVLSHPGWNGLAGLSGEGVQGFQGMQGDLPGGNEASYLIMINGEGQVVPHPFGIILTRIRDYFNRGDNL
jgi:hypothetical protein